MNSEFIRDMNVVIKRFSDMYKCVKHVVNDDNSLTKGKSDSFKLGYIYSKITEIQADCNEIIVSFEKKYGDGIVIDNYSTYM